MTQCSHFQPAPFCVSVILGLGLPPAPWFSRQAAPPRAERGDVTKPAVTARVGPRMQASGCAAVAMATPYRPLGCHGSGRGKGLPVAPPEVPAGAGSGPEARPARQEGRGVSAGRESGDWTLPVPERRSRGCPGRRGTGAAGCGRSCSTGAQSGDTPPLPPRGPCTGRWRRREAAAAVARGRRAGPGCESRGGTGGERRRMSLLCAQYLR